MAKNLIIVESPAKTRTLKKFLGRDWAVEASVGHIRDLPKKNMGLKEDYEPVYAILPAKKEVVKKLKAAALKAERIYLAPDPDREGEAIAWHIAEVLGQDPEKIHRVTFNEITRHAVLKALEHPGEIDRRKVDAQQARRILDRLMGFKLSPLLWEKVKQGLSAGRVQSVALKMICDRQAEIDAFTPEEYWLLGARLEGPEPPPFFAKLHQIEGKKAKVENGEQAAAIERALHGGQFRVAAVERKESKQRPTPPFITSRLQQEAARRFGFSVKRTMALAQGLYEGKMLGERGSVGLITYMRTDSTRVAEEALSAARDYIAAQYGADKLPHKPTRYASRKGAQDAHEAIRPTYFDLPPESVARFLAPDELKLYRLIWERFIASQMLPAVFDVTQVDIENGAYTLRATGRVMKSPGFLAVYRDLPEENGSKEEPEGEAQIPSLSEGEILKLLELAKEQKFTQPAAQYSEATLVKALEENGIGRPSTYAAILAILTDRDYCEKTGGRFRPTELGRVVHQLLQTGFHDIINERYTAHLEEKLDKIEDGKLGWKEALVEFDRKFDRDLKAAGRKLPSYKKEGVPTEESCPRCGSPLVMRFGRYGAFLGCSNYNGDPKCDYTRDVAGEASDEKAAAEAALVPPCELCGKPMALRRSRYGAFYGCTGYPECRNIRKIGPAAPPPKETGVACPECNEGKLLEKRTRRGKTFFSCNRYPKCKFALWNRPVAATCPRCGSTYLVEKTSKKKGSRLVCSSEGCGFERQLPESAA